MQIETSTTVQHGIHQVTRTLAAFPVVCFTCALCTDLAYWRTTNVLWMDFSTWLLAAGMAGGGLALVAGIVGWLAGHRRRASRQGWIMPAGFVLTLAVALLNNFVHSRDAWTAVVPEGLMLSALTVLIMLALGWAGGAIGRQAIAVQSTSGARP